MTDRDADKTDEKELSFFRELSRRHVFASALAYVVGSWAIIQVADVLAPEFGAPEWTLRAITTVLILLFPMAIVLSWEYDISLKGVAKTEGDYDRGLSSRHWFRRSIVALISFASLGAVAWVWSTGMLTDSRFDADDEFPKVIAVAGFQAFSQPETEWLGQGLSNLIRDNLTQSQYLRVVSSRRWNALTSDVADEDVLAAAEQADIRYLMQGEIISNRTGHVLTVRLTDTRTGEQLEAQTFEVDEEGSLLERATSIAQIARARLRVPVQERVDLFAADYASEHPSAYRAFVGALDYWVNYEFRDAERLLRAAIELQPDFAMAAYYLSLNLDNQDNRGESRELLDSALNAAAISERDRDYLQALSFYIDKDWQASSEAYAALIERYPSDTEARTLHAEALTQIGDYAAALEGYQAISRLEPEVQTGWTGIAYINILTGNYDDAMPAINTFAEIAPENPNVYVLRGDANRARGELEAARDDYRTAIEKGPDLQEAVVSLGRTEYLLGDIDAALQTLSGLATDEKAVLRFRISAGFEAGAILNSVGRISAHIELLESLEEQFVASGGFYAKALADSAFARMLVGDSGDETRALINRSIEQSPGVATRYLFHRGLLELYTDQFDAVAATAESIRSLALPAENPDRTEDMAADFLLGVRALRLEQFDEAQQRVASIELVDGYWYRDYRLLKAQVLLAQGDNASAINVLEQMQAPPDFVSPRLDLEIDKQLARALLVRALSADGDQRRAESVVPDLQLRWRDADEGFAGTELLVLE
ncbi:MAG: tetratricopeptide repeat protein [Pseudomonadota bacterium]